jgi:hypothetical protein
MSDRQVTMIIGTAGVVAVCSTALEDPRTACAGITACGIAALMGIPRPLGNPALVQNAERMNWLPPGDIFDRYNQAAAGNGWLRRANFYLKRRTYPILGPKRTGCFLWCQPVH